LTSPDRSTPVLSVVVPVYNEESVLPLLAQRLRPVLDGLGEPYEVLAVDDGSTDASVAVLTGIRKSWPQLRLLRLRRNYGHQAALVAGLFRADGDFVVSMDADLQDPPDAIPEMLSLARRAGLDIVYGVREDRRSDTVFKRWTAAGYYWLMRRLVNQPVPAHAGDFRLLSRTTVDVLRELPGQTKVLRLLVPWIGLPAGEVRYVREARAAGRTKYPVRKMVRLAVDSITNFSSKPLRIATWLGAVGVLAAAAMLVMAFARYLRHDTVSGWASIFVAVMFLGALQLLCLGLLGEYVGRIFDAVQGRPMYAVRSDTGEQPDRPACEETTR
jgi:dolichol-phosphate mannosyltransferase